jgi:hypothetical protein
MICPELLSATRTLCDLERKFESWPEHTHGMPRSLDVCLDHCPIGLHLGKKVACHLQQLCNGTA